MRPLAEFPRPEDVGYREWGKEQLLVLSPGKYTMKYIFMHAGAKGGLQYHRKKDESGYMLEGAMRVRFDNDGELKEAIVGPGDSFRFPPGCVHQAEAITDCAYIECSTPHFNDRVHVEDEFGIKEEAGGLPTTEAKDIEVR